MRRALIIAAAAAALLSPCVAAAQDHGGWRRGEAYDHMRRQTADHDRRGGRGRGEDRGRDDRAGDRYGRGPDLPRGGGPREAPTPYRAAPERSGRSWRQGEYLPPMYRGSVVRDPGRYRLRAPPPGYDWVGVAPNIYLMQRGTGMVLDAIPGGD
jgi:Ni/Co efflux regulator RcnB